MRSQHLKRCLALLLSLALIITAMPMQVLASTVESDIQTTSDVKTYTITFYADKEMTTVLQQVTVEEGKVPEWNIPEKDPDEYYRYEFVGWDEEPSKAYTDKYYIAEWREIEQFSILFLDWDGKEVLDKPLRVDKGTDLTKCEDVPMDLEREKDIDYTYEFIGWSPELSTSVTEDVTYTAQYKATEIITYVDLTFDVASNGSYTVDGKEITEETEILDATTKNEYVLKATAAPGYEFFGWYDGTTYLSGDAEYKFRPTEDMVIKPKFVEENTPKLMVDGVMYDGLARAATAAKKSNSDGVMVLMNDVTLTTTFRIPEGVTLLIPHDEKAEVYRDKPAYKDETWVEPTAYRTLTLAKGANLVVDGEISITSPHVPGAGSKENGGSPHKAYGQIVTESESSITVNDGGALYAYGYITGEGTVTAKSGATVYEYFQIMDFRGGSATTAMASTGAKFGVFPLSQYYVQNIEIPLTIEAGAKEFCYTSLKMSGNIVSSPVGFIGNGDDMMFKLKSGSVTKYYDGERDRLVAEIDGDLDISPIVISGGGNTVDSDNFVLPINSNITIKANSGTINMTQDVALTPGSELFIGKDATCALGEDCNVYVYDQDTWGVYCSSNRQTFVDVNYAPGKNYTRTDADLVDALVQVDGVLDASKGYLYTTKGGANICSTGNGKIVLRAGSATKTYQYEYKGPEYDKATYYGQYHEIPIERALLKNADGSFVNQEKYADKNIINYTYTDGVWTLTGHPYNEYEAEPASCLFEGRTYGTSCDVENCGIHNNPPKTIPALGHSFTTVVPEKAPTYTSVGWNEHHVCDRCNAKGDDYEEIAKLEGAAILSYDEFIENLEILEDWANDYVKINPGKDPLALVIKYIRTGVDRYNSGSWKLMAGYEDEGFAAYVAAREDAVNTEAANNGTPLVKVSGLKNIENFTLSNGDLVDFGHMFGTMDITYHNKFSENHADIAGWAGDIIDLVSLADQFGVGGATDINAMADYVYNNYLFKETSDLQKEHGEELKEGSFSLVDMYGDLDGYYIMKVLQNSEYGPGVLTTIIKQYFNSGLTAEIRAKYLLENRFDDISLRIDLRDQVYYEVSVNGAVKTLEGTREFEREGEEYDTLKKACCYAFADYICKMAGDYVEALENPYISVFDSKFSTLAPGITQKIYQARTADGKQTDYYVTTADISRDDVEVWANYNDNDPGKGWALQRVLDQAQAVQDKYGNPDSELYRENFNVIASINGDGFNMSTGEPGGLLVMDNVEWHPSDGAGFFGILNDGSAVIGTHSDYLKLKSQGKVKEAIGGFGTTLVKDGKVHVTATSDYYTDRAGRTAVGITKTGKVVFMVMDGRQGEYTCGGSMTEIAQVMLDAGCVQAINLDGGGSTTYVARPEGETELKVVNKPSDGVARSVSTSLVMISTAPSSTAFDHAVIESNYDYLTVGSSVNLKASGVSATNNATEVPEGTVWKVEDPEYGDVTAAGVFTAKKEGSVTVQLLLDDAVVGTKTLHVVKPDNLYFMKTNVNAVYGQTVEVPVKVVYENKPVAVNPADLTFKVSDEKAGKMEGMNFVVSSETTLKRVDITVGLPNSDATAMFTIYLYSQGEASFDFDQAVGGTRQFAWIRNVSNAITQDDMIYSATDAGAAMTTSYTFAIDMSKIEIPKRLEDLTYMLPGSDLETASAWSFLCQLAERMSDMTNVTATIQFDKNVTVENWDKIKLVNDYFKLTKAEFNEEDNTLTITLNWIKQDKPINTEQANPICILSGLKITPKDNAQWSSANSLKIVNRGEISYSVYMRASGLYTFSQNPKNQEIYGLTDFVNPNNESERGGKFSATYNTFEDSFVLDRSVKNGWVPSAKGFSYFVDGKMYKGICYVEKEKLYYNFGESGVIAKKEPYTGEMTKNKKEYYVFSGEIFKRGASMWSNENDNGWLRIGDNDWRFYDPKTGVRETVKKEVVVKGTCVNDTVYRFTAESGASKELKHNDAGGHEYVEYANGKVICKVCNWQRLEIKDLDIELGHTVYTYTGKAKEPGIYAYNPVTKKKVSGSGLYRDFNRTYYDNIEVGQAKVKIAGRKNAHYSNVNEWRGNYKGSIYMYFTIVPDAPTNAKGVYNNGTVKLTWDKAKVEETDTKASNTTYVIYKSVNGGKWTKVGTTTKCSYTIKSGMKNDDDIKLRIKAKKKGHDGKTYESVKYASVSMTYKTPKLVAGNSAKTGKVKLTWGKVTGAKNYVVYKATSKSGTYTKVATTSKNYFVDTKTTAGKTYYYKMKVVKRNGGTQYANPATATCAIARPVVTASNVSSTGKIKLSWKKVDGAKKYVVYRATSKDGTYKKLSTTTKTYLVNNSTTAGKTYYYKVKALARKSSANSAYSEIDSRTCDLKRPVVTVKSTVKKQAKLSWKKVEGAKKYEIYRAASKNGKYKKVATTTKLTYTNKSLTSKKTYYYKVKAIADTSAANSASSLAKSVKVK